MTDKPSKYLFDLYDFDAPGGYNAHLQVAPEEVIDMPVVFTEEELSQQVEQARTEAFERGKKQASEQAQASTEKATLQVLQQVVVSCGTLVAQEQERRDLFEQEVVALFHATMQKALPQVYEQFGGEALQAFVVEVLHKHENQAPILIQLHPDNIQEIEKRIQQTPALAAMNVECVAHEGIQLGACKIDWQDGGAAINPQAFIEEICEKLRSPLAPTGEKEQNEASVADENPPALTNGEDNE